MTKASLQAVFHLEKDWLGRKGVPFLLWFLCFHSHWVFLCPLHCFLLPSFRGFCPPATDSLSALLPFYQRWSGSMRIDALFKEREREDENDRLWGSRNKGFIIAWVGLTSPWAFYISTVIVLIVLQTAALSVRHLRRCSIAFGSSWGGLSAPLLVTWRKSSGLPLELFRFFCHLSTRPSISCLYQSLHTLPFLFYKILLSR